MAGNVDYGTKDAYCLPVKRLFAASCSDREIRNHPDGQDNCGYFPLIFEIYA